MRCPSTSAAGLFFLMLCAGAFAPGAVRAAERDAASDPSGSSATGEQNPFAEGAPEAYAASVRPVLVEYCGACHDPADESNPVDFLRSKRADQINERRGLWASVAEQLHNRTMPPAQEPQPSEKQRLQVARWIRAYLQRTACSGGKFAGNPVPRRLNRDQYTYAVEDLTGLDFDFVETFPADGGGGEGFNNNGETLFLPPLLMERYLEVAQQIVDRAIVTRPIDTTLLGKGSDETASEATATPNGAEASENAEASGAVSLGAGESTSVLATAYTDSDFRLSVTASAEAGSRSKSQGAAESVPAELVLQVDGIAAGRLPIAEQADQADRPAEPVTVGIHLARGPHRLTLSAPEGGAAVRIERLRLRQVVENQPQRERREQATQRLLAPAGDLVDSDPETAARKILRHFARRAWRRQLREDEIERLMDLYRRGTQRGEPLRQALKLPLKAVLVSPKFLFLVEREHDRPGIHPISDLELASRLSFFLWYSLPDQELIELAVNDQLHRPSVLRAQVRRMLADERSHRFAKAFAGQWLGTVAVGRTKIPDTNFFKPVYTPELVADLRRQVGETMHWMLKNNRPLTEWLDCDYVVVNERLAKHYGIEPRPEGNEFVKVQLEAGDGERRRAGVLGLGAVHMLTSYARRTSPVLRGGWVLETMFGTRLPPPPPDVPSLPGGEKEIENKTVRERLQQHRADPTCAACHDLIDPIGFALENFDVLGQWRDKEGDQPIDARGKLPSGETFTGPTELRKVLLERREEFLRELCRRMLGFALGRSLHDADACTVSHLAERLGNNEYRAEELILGVVESLPFQARGSAPEQGCCEAGG